MRIMKAISGRPIVLGYEGENEAAQVQIDIVKSWTDLYGEGGTFTVLMQRPRAEESYPKVTEIVDGSVCFTVDAADLVYPGMGAVIVRYMVGDTIAKSEIYSTRIRGSIGAEGETPEPYQAWVDEVLSASANVGDAVERAENARDAAEAAEQNAETSATNASTSATNASYSALSAEQSADDAEQSADSAEASAVRAEEAAESITPTDVRINGQSITEGGVADIPYASPDVFGLISYHVNGGLGVNSQGKLTVNPASKPQIDSRNNFYQPIVPNTISYAVKSAMSAPVSATDPAWTEAEKSSARERMSLEFGFEKIIDITTEEDADALRLSFGYDLAEMIVLYQTVADPNASGSSVDLFATQRAANTGTVNSRIAYRPFHVKSISTHFIHSKVLGHGLPSYSISAFVGTALYNTWYSTGPTMTLSGDPRTSHIDTFGFMGLYGNFKVPAGTRIIVWGIKR